jgi:hypothetical protein
MSERVFYPDANDESSTSKVVACSIAVFRFNASTKPYDFFPLQRFNDSTNHVATARHLSEMCVLVLYERRAPKAIAFCI